MFRTSLMHPQGDSCICSVVCMYYMHRCEQSCGQESHVTYTHMIKEGAWVRFGLYLGGGEFESSAGPSDLGFRGFSYAEANFEPVSVSRTRSVPFVSVNNASFTIHSAIATYVAGKKKKRQGVIRRIKPYSIWFPRNTVLIPRNTAFRHKMLVPKLRKFMQCMHPVVHKPCWQEFDNWPCAELSQIYAFLSCIISDPNSYTEGKQFVSIKLQKVTVREHSGY